MTERERSPETLSSSSLLGKSVLTGAEIAALVWELGKEDREQQRLRDEQAQHLNELLLKELQKSNNFQFMMVGDGQFKGELPRLREGQERLAADVDDVKRGLRSTRTRVRRMEERQERNEQTRERQHAENLLTREQDQAEHSVQMRRLEKQLRAIRRERIWFVRKFNRFFDWCTATDDQGRYSRKKIGVFVAAISGAIASAVAFVAGVYRLLTPMLNRLGTTLGRHL